MEETIEIQVNVSFIMSLQLNQFCRYSNVYFSINCTILQNAVAAAEDVKEFKHNKILNKMELHSSNILKWERSKHKKEVKIWRIKRKNWRWKLLHKKQCIRTNMISWWQNTRKSVMLGQKTWRRVQCHHRGVQEEAWEQEVASCARVCRTEKGAEANSIKRKSTSSVYGQELQSRTEGKLLLPFNIIMHVCHYIMHF